MATRQPAKPRKRAETSPVEIRQLRQLIEETAYYKAKERGFAPGHELDDWVAAEAEVRRRMDL